MKFLIKAELDLEAANEIIREGKLASTIRSILDKINHECAYFFVSGGKRSALIVVEMEDASQITRIAEPLFKAFKAKVQCIPVMPLGELGKTGNITNESLDKYQ